MTCVVRGPTGQERPYRPHTTGLSTGGLSQLEIRRSSRVKARYPGYRVVVGFVVYGAGEEPDDRRPVSRVLNVGPRLQGMGPRPQR